VNTKKLNFGFLFSNGFNLLIKGIFTDLWNLVRKNILLSNYNSKTKVIISNNDLTMQNFVYWLRNLNSSFFRVIFIVPYFSFICFI